MPSNFLRPMASLLQNAEREGYAVGAFNCSSIQQVAVVVRVANTLQSPVIVQAISGINDVGDSLFWALTLRLIEAEAEIPIAFHLDHGRTFDDCRRAIDSGFTSVMRDASRHPGTGAPMPLDENIAETLRVVDYARNAGVSVEGEIGTVGGGGEGDDRNSGAFDYQVSNLEEAVTFATETKVHAMALAVGTSHGAVKFPPGQQPRLRFDLIDAVHRAVPQVALVLHGSSSVPQEHVTIINSHGGHVFPSTGITQEDKRKAISCGIRKVNQGTDSHLGWTSTLRKHMAGNPSEIDPVGYLTAGMVGMSQSVATAIQVFGSDGRA